MCELAGLADPDPSIDIDAPRFASMEDAPDDIDGVIIATPTALHGDMGLQAAARGWHMLIEKPVAETLPQAEALVRTVRAAGVGALVGHHRRFHAPLQQLRKLIAEERIGVPVNISLIWAMKKPDSYFAGNWRAADGSPVMINLVHDVDVLRFVFGEIEGVAALRGANLRQTNRIESGAVALSFASGATGTIAFTDYAPSPWGFEAGTGENPNIGTTHQDMLWITGTRGAISFPSLQMWCGVDWSRPAAQRPVRRDVNTKPPLLAQLDHFLEVIDGAAPQTGIEDATRTLATTLEIERQLRRDPHYTPAQASLPSSIP
jgi:predicted dehydrogenase